MHRPVYHLLPEHSRRLRAATGAVAAGEPRRHRKVEEKPEDVAVLAPGGGIEHIGDAVLSFAEDKQRVLLQEQLDKAQIAGGGGGVEEPTAVSAADEGVFAAALGVTFGEEAAGDGGAGCGDAVELVVVAGVAVVLVPDGFEAADAAEGGEREEVVGVEAEELSDEVVVAVGGGPVDRSGVPPLVAGAFPPEREVIITGRSWSWSWSCWGYHFFIFFLDISRTNQPTHTKTEIRPTERLCVCVCVWLCVYVCWTESEY